MSPRPFLLLALLGGFAFGAALLFRQGPDTKPTPPPTEDGAEARALAGSGGLARRDGHTLFLRLKGGETVALADRSSCGELPCPAPMLVGYRYLGWDEGAGGYRLAVTQGQRGGETVLLPFAEDAARFETPLPLPSPATRTPLPPPPPPAIADDPALLAWAAELASSRDKVEVGAITAAAGRAERDGPRLTFTLADRRRLTFTDDILCGQTTCPEMVLRSFRHAGSSSDGRHHLVAERWSEDEDALLVAEKDGSVTLLAGTATFSPDGRHVVAVRSETSPGALHEIAVWALSGPTPVLEFTHGQGEPGEDLTVYEIGEWKDGEHLTLRQGPWGEPGKAGAMLAHGPNGWHVAPTDAGE